MPPGPARTHAAVFLVALLMAGCRLTPVDRFGHARIAGCWRGGVVRDGAIADEDQQLRVLSLKPDGALALTAIVELGPRSRVWKYDFDVTYRDNRISWLAHQGEVTDDGGSMRVTKNWQGEQSEWRFVRDRDADRLVAELLSTDHATCGYELPPDLGDQWPNGHLKDAGVDEARIARLLDQVEQGRHGDLHGILIARRGTLVLEQYFAANGESCGPVVANAFRNRVHHLASVTKLLTSALTGVAVGRGLIGTVEQPVLSFFPEYPDLGTHERRRIALRHLLTMTAGLQWEQSRYPFSDRRNDGGEMYRTPDVPAFVLSKPLAAEPGRRFLYSNGLATVMGAVITRATGQDVSAFAAAALFGPLGITDYLWARYPDGTTDTDGGLALRLRDLGKIGQLYLNGGRWGEVQVIPESWIRESTRGRVRLSRQRAFGYYWNEWTLDAGGRQERALCGPGDGGQFVAVFPEHELVIAITAGNYDRDPTATYRTLIMEHILPALSGDSRGTAASSRP